MPSAVLAVCYSKAESEVNAARGQPHVPRRDAVSAVSSGADTFALQGADRLGCWCQGREKRRWKTIVSLACDEKMPVRSEWTRVAASGGGGLLIIPLPVRHSVV